ncbi:MAG: TetR/AcrR family transcriptional regulator [Marmoricola sp.]
MKPEQHTTERRRLSAEERRSLVLAAATRAFARSGYAGTSTDAIAKEAGVSQPYVVRIFGTKLELFLDVLDDACERIRTTFEGVLASPGFDAENEADRARLGDSYVDLVLHERDVLLVLMHGFAAGDSDEIAARARAGFGRIWATITSSGCTEEEARAFIAQGMLLNVLLSMRAHEHPTEAGLASLTACAFDGMLDDLTA